MAELTRDYPWTYFTIPTITEALRVFKDFAPDVDPAYSGTSKSLCRGNEDWTYDSWAEFCDEYGRPPFDSARFESELWRSSLKRLQNFSLSCEYPSPEQQARGASVETTVYLRMETKEQVLAVAQVFESALPTSTVERSPVAQPLPATPKVFVGHGQSTQWRDLKDHLHEQHEYVVEAYEIGARTSHTVKEVLEQMMESSSVALLVFTAENTDIEGLSHARENVIHELGLFQGRLGWSKAAVVLEDGVQEFSNIQGTTQIRFSRGRIAEAYGPILAFLRRELR